MSDIKHDNDFNEQELVNPISGDEKHVETDEIIKKHDLSLKEPTLDEIEAETAPTEFDPRHRDKQEALNMYLQDEISRKTKGQH